MGICNKLIEKNVFTRRLCKTYSFTGCHFPKAFGKFKDPDRDFASFPMTSGFAWSLIVTLT